MKGFDTFATVRPEWVSQLSALGYTFFARYYRRAPLEGGKGNALSLAEARGLLNAGFFALAIYQNSSNTPSYFTPINADLDAQAAIAAAHHKGQPHDTTIYFSVDCNPSQAELPSIVLYFQRVHEVLWHAGYKTGVYGSGLVCKTLFMEGTVHNTWLSNATGWWGYKDWLPYADVVQTTLPFTLPFGLSIDADECKDPIKAGMWHMAPPPPPPAPPAQGLFSKLFSAIFRLFGRSKP